MVVLEKSELNFSKCPTKNYITPPTEKNVNPLEKRNLNHPLPPIYTPYHHAPDVFLFFQFPLLKKTDNAQLCRPTGKIRAHRNNIDNRP